MNDVSTAENECDFQRLVYNFTKACQKCNTKIAEEKTKSTTISHHQFTCKLVINDRIIEEIMQIDYLELKFTSNNRVDE